MNKMYSEPAFPTSNGGSPDDGMDLRDSFAAKALNGLLAAGRDIQYGEGCMTSLSEASYKIANAMLEARNRK